MGETMPESTIRDGYVKGSLTQVPFAKVLNFINQAGKSGILALSQGKRKVHIHFDRGEIVYVTSSYFPDMSLGDYLVKEGKISKEINDESVDNCRQDKTKQGAYLVEKGHLSPHELYEALNKQVTEKLFKLFLWAEGEFFFREGEIIGEEHRILNISFPNLLYRGIRFYLPLDRPPVEFRGRKEDIIVKRFAGRYKIEDLKLGPAEVRIYNLVNGERTLRQIVSLANMNKRIAYKVLYALYLLEMVGFPEAFRSDRITKMAKEKRTPRTAGGGFEISISNDLIAEAMASVDRIREEVQKDDEFEDFEEPERPARVAKPAKPAKQTVEADFVSKVDQSLGAATPPRRESIRPEAPVVDPFAQAPVARAAETPTGHDLFGDATLEPPASPAEKKSAIADDLGFGAETDAFGTEEFSAEEPEPDSSLFMDVDDYSNPEDLIKQAGYLLDDGNWTEARRFLTKALDLDENNADAYALLGWAIFNDEADNNRVNQSEQIIRKGMRINPGRYLHFLYLGKIYAAMKQYEFAELHFVKALELNHECSEAKDEIKRIHQR